MKNILLNTGFLAFVICGSAGLQISALMGLLMILAAGMNEGESGGEGMLEYDDDIGDTGSS